MKKLCCVIAAVAVLFVVMPVASYAQSAGVAQQQERISRLIIRGNLRVEDGTVMSYMDVRAGDIYDPQALDTSLKTLFGTGLFADVKFTKQGSVVYLDVVENPIINRVVFEGEKALDKDDFLEEVQLRPRLVYTRAKAQADLQRILDLYRRKGRFSASVVPKVIELPQNRVDLVFEISEGPKSGIRRLNFLGNQAFRDRKLRGVLVTKESRWWNLLASNDNYDPDRITYDRELMRQFYEGRGYADFSVTSSVAEMAPDLNNFFVTFTIDEGEIYTFGEVEIDTTLEDVDEGILKSLVRFKEGEIYNNKKIEDTVDSLTFATGAAGYAFADVEPRLKRDRENRIMNVVFRINEGSRVYIERINVVGNTRTLDRVIRREMQLSEGDAFNRIQIDRSKGRIRGLRYFEEVEIEEEAGSAPDRTVVNVKVKEQPTGEFTFGVGFSSSDQVAGDLSVSESNLLGRGQFLRFRVSGSNRRQQVDISFTEPYLFGRALMGGFDLYRSVTDFKREAGFELKSTGLTLRTGFPLNQFSRIMPRYTIRSDEIDVSDISCLIGVISRAICDEQGKRLTSTLGYTYFMDRRNDMLRPSRGYDLLLQQDIAGLGGDTKYLRTEIAMNAYRRLYFKNVIGSLTWDTGFIFPLGKDEVRLQDRFRKGGSDFRGFEIAGLGPRDIITEDSLGGQAYGIATVEVSFPTGLPEQYGIDASLFFQAGTVGYIADGVKNDITQQVIDRNAQLPVGSPQFPLPRIEDKMAIRASTGVSIFWDSPFGPVRLDFAKVLLKEDYDETEKFRFSAGTRF